MKRIHTYKAYSIGLAVVWAVILIAITVVGPASKAHTLYLVGAGFFIGWVSTTIARFVYPPPAKWTSQTQAKND